MSSLNSHPEKGSEAGRELGDDHDCEDCAALGGLPCWDCYDAGRRAFDDGRAA